MLSTQTVQHADPAATTRRRHVVQCWLAVEERCVTSCVRTPIYIAHSSRLATRRPIFAESNYELGNWHTVSVCRTRGAHSPIQDSQKYIHGSPTVTPPPVLSAARTMFSVVVIVILLLSVSFGACASLPAHCL